MRSAISQAACAALGCVKPGGLGSLLVLAALAVASPWGEVRAEDPGSAQGSASTESRTGNHQPAMPSALASRRLLTAVARAGTRLVAVGDHGHILLSDDRGSNWRQAAQVPVRVLLTSVFFVTPQTGWATGHDAVILATRDGGETWDLQYSDPEAEAPLLTIHFTSPTDGLAAGAFAMMLETRNGGATWVPRDLQGRASATGPVSTGSGGGGSAQDGHLNHIFAGADGTLYIAGEFGLIHRSGPGERAFTTTETGYEGSFWGGLEAADGSVLAFGMRGTIWSNRAAGGGAPEAGAWRPVVSGIRQSLSGGTVLEDGTVMLAGLGGTLLWSQDHGRSFEATVLPSREDLTAALPGEAGDLVVFGEGGVSRIRSPIQEAPALRR